MSYEGAKADIYVKDMIVTKIMFSARTGNLCFHHEQQSYVFSTNSKVMFSARIAKLCFQQEQQSYVFSTNSKVMFSTRTAKLCFQHE